MSSTTPRIGAADYFPDATSLPEAEASGLSTLGRGLVGSEILKISGEIRSLTAAGKSVCNLTVGDFSSTEFRIPRQFEEAIIEALAAGETNYPPSDGLLALRQAVLAFYERDLGLGYPVESILIAGGARPLIYAAYLALVDPGEKVLYPTPSWNNNHYAYLSGAQPVELVVGPETNFLPTAELLRPLLPGARLLALNSPLNPTGTVFSEEQVREIATMVVEENERRRKARERALFILWDQVYWMLTFGDRKHHTPPEVVPAAAAWTIFVDGISKAFAATGLRVGWSLAPPYVTGRMRDIVGHMGAWAPRPEQVATAKIISNTEVLEEFHSGMIREVRLRLDLLHDGFQSMKSDGLPVESVPPQGAIYLSAQFRLLGREIGGTKITSNEQIRRLLLDEAGFAVVPFQAFGLKQNEGWMRLSVGAVSPSQIEDGLVRVRRLLERTR